MHAGEKLANSECSSVPGSSRAFAKMSKSDRIEWRDFRDQGIHDSFPENEWLGGREFL